MCCEEQKRMKNGRYIRIRKFPGTFSVKKQKKRILQNLHVLQKNSFQSWQKFIPFTILLILSSGCRKWDAKGEA